MKMHLVYEIYNCNIVTTATAKPRGWKTKGDLLCYYIQHVLISKTNEFEIRIGIYSIPLHNIVETLLKIFILVDLGWSFLSVAWPTGFNCCFSFASDFQYCCLAPRAFHRRTAYCICKSSFLFILDVIMIYLFVLDDSLTS